MQDPIEVAANFVKLWSDGFKIVYGVRKNRSENFIITLVRKFFYRSLNAISDIGIPVDAGDFRLLDREVYERLRYIKDPEPYLRGIVSAFGYKQHGVPYERSARSRGESKFPFKQMYKLGLNGVFNHSLLPLRLATICGIVGAFICLISFVIYLIASIFYGRSWPAGFSTIVLLIFLQFSVMSLFFGILGEYIGRIYRFIKPSKFVICEKTANIDKAEVIIPL
jgi:dolichol-phosphate mannosyltransferase